MIQMDGGPFNPFVPILLGLSLFISGCVVPSGPGGPRVPTEGSLLEYGDAPDPTFPSQEGSDGARHKDINVAWLGDGVDLEHGPDLINLDEFDDGVGLVPTLPCADTTIPVTISLKDRADAAHPFSSAKDELLYLNMVFDFDNNQDWGFDTTVCDEDQPVNEWQVVNYPIDASLWAAGELRQTIRVPVKMGNFEKPFCFRATLTYGETIDTKEWTGVGSFAFGETEDYCPGFEEIPFCGDGVVDPWAGEVCDPPGSVCAMIGMPAGGVGIVWCNNLCQCPLPPPKKYPCYAGDEFFPRPAGAFNPLTDVCIDNCPPNQDLICDPRVCECVEKDKVFCVGDLGAPRGSNKNFNPATQVCIDNCPDDEICDPTCNCVEKPEKEPFNCLMPNVTTTKRFDPEVHACVDACDEGYTCDVESCICEKEKEKEPVNCRMPRVTTTQRFDPEENVCVPDACEVGYICDAATCICDEIIIEGDEYSCSGNTTEVDRTDENPFIANVDTCSDDCPSGYLCNASSCTCTKDPEAISCGANTEYVIENDQNPYSAEFDVCADDCPGTQICNASSCTCTKAPEEFSCGSNTEHQEAFNENPFLNFNRACVADCPGNDICDTETCTCLKVLEGVICSGNTAYNAQYGENTFDPEINACLADECGEGLTCNTATCLCESETDEKEIFACTTGTRTESFDANTQVCFADNCDEGAECNLETCSCEEIIELEKQPYPCQASDDNTSGSFDSGLHICETDNCKSGEVCDIETCWCQPAPEKTNYPCATGTVTESFDPALHVCQTDNCSEGYTCNTSICACEADELAQLSCLTNKYYVDETGENPYDSATYACQDDCPEGYFCNESCVCIHQG